MAASKKSSMGKKAAKKSSAKSAKKSSATAVKSAKGSKSASASTSSKASKASSASSASKKSASKKSASKKKQAPALSVADKQRLLKPLTGFPDLVARLATTWKAHGRLIKVPGLSPAALLSKLRRAQKAGAREDALKSKLEAQLQPLADARLLAEHDVWKSALDVHAMAKTAGRTDPALSSPFEFFGDVFSNKKKSTTAPEPIADDADEAGGEE